MTKEQQNKQTNLQDTTIAIKRVSKVLSAGTPRDILKQAAKDSFSGIQRVRIPSIYLHCRFISLSDMLYMLTYL